MCDASRAKTPTIFGRNEASSESIVCRLVTKFETTASDLTVKSPRRKSFCRTEEQLVFVRDGVITKPEKSIRRSLQQLDIPTSSLHQILHKDLYMHAYKIQLTQIMGGGGEFADWVLERFAVDNNFAKRIIFSDEAHFY